MGLCESLLAGITLRLKLQWMGAAQSSRNGEKEEGGIEPERKRVLGGGARGDPAISNSVFYAGKVVALATRELLAVCLI